MVFGIGYGELAVIVAMSAVILGPKDLPVVARALGRFSGQAVGFLYKARRQFDAYADRSELSKLHEELQHGLHEISAIRNEIRSGVAILRHDPSLGAAPTRPPVDQPAPQLPSDQVGSTAPRESLTSPSTVGDRYSPSHAPGHGSTHNATPTVSRHAGHGPINASLPPIAAAAVDIMRAESFSGETPALPGGPGLLYGSSEGPGGDNDRSGTWEPLPVSAVVAGLLPVRQGKDVTATDIFADALEEREIARKSLNLVQQHTRSGVREAL